MNISDMRIEFTERFKTGQFGALLEPAIVSCFVFLDVFFVISCCFGVVCRNWVILARIPLKFLRFPVCFPNVYFQTTLGVQWEVALVALERLSYLDVLRSRSTFRSSSMLLHQPAWGKAFFIHQALVKGKESLEPRLFVSFFFFFNSPAGGVEVEEAEDVVHCSVAVILPSLCFRKSEHSSPCFTIASQHESSEGFTWARVTPKESWPDIFASIVYLN